MLQASKIVGKAASEFKKIHTEVRYRPEHSGAKESHEHFKQTLKKQKLS
jgi:hypothetical protein